MLRAVLSKRVSIHAPVQGATEQCYGQFFPKEFQSTLLYKERHMVIADESSSFKFQSTLLYKERLH